MEEAVGQTQRSGVESPQEARGLRGRDLDELSTWIGRLPRVMANGPEGETESGVIALSRKWGETQSSPCTQVALPCPPGQAGAETQPTHH